MPGRLYEATWGRIFAAGYDRVLAPAEDAGLRDRRRALLRAARGRVLELGSGTGVNIGLYPETIEELVCTEPSAHMAAKLRAKLAETGIDAEVQEVSAEQLPFPDDSFDTVVATLVLCTIPHPERALAEAARVLRPGGRLLFLEHVRSEDPSLARWQDRLHTPWLYFGAGCHCNRETLAAIEASGLELEEVEHGRIPKALPLVRPMIAGSARA